MRIAHVVSTYPPYRGGQGNVARELAGRTATRGYEVVVVTPKKMQNAECRMQNDNSKIHHSSFIIHHSVPWLRFGNAAWSPTIARILEEERVSIVHLHWPFIGGIAPVLRWRRSQAASQRRLIVQYHMDLIGSGWRGCLFAAYQRWALSRVLAAADRIVVSLIDYARHGALAPYIERLGDRLIEIPIGVDLSRFAPRSLPPTPPLPAGRGETKKVFSPSRWEGEREGEGNNGTMEQWNNSFKVLFVGGLDRAHAFKGLPVLLAAMQKKGPGPFSLRIVGDGDLRSEYERQARQLSITDRVEFLGSVPDAELPTIYRSADVLVLPSTSRSEAFGVVLLEAMASGTPVIASDLPGVRTVVADGETGFLVPLGDVAALADRLTLLAQDPERARTMGAAARRRVEGRYGWDRIIDVWNQCYQFVVGQELAHPGK